MPYNKSAIITDFSKKFIHLHDPLLFASIESTVRLNLKSEFPKIIKISANKKNRSTLDIAGFKAIFISGPGGS